MSPFFFFPPSSLTYFKVRRANFQIFQTRDPPIVARVSMAARRWFIPNEAVRTISRNVRQLQRCAFQIGGNKYREFPKHISLPPSRHEDKSKRVPSTPLRSLIFSITTLHFAPSRYCATIVELCSLSRPVHADIRFGYNVLEKRTVHSSMPRLM